jgi:hypothetical protein
VTVFSDSKEEELIEKCATGDQCNKDMIARQMICTARADQIVAHNTLKGSRGTISMWTLCQPREAPSGLFLLLREEARFVAPRRAARAGSNLS